MKMPVSRCCHDIAPDHPNPRNNRCFDSFLIILHHILRVSTDFHRVPLPKIDRYAELIARIFHVFCRLVDTAAFDRNFSAPGGCER